MNTMEDLFETITKIIAAPTNDKQRAIQVFLAFDDYLIDEVPSYVQSECDDIDFGAFAAGKIDELEEKRRVKEELDKTGIAYLNGVLIAEEF
jgi:hypothetical protein